MTYLLTIVAFVVIFSVLILIHEFGHFIMAKRAGIKVEEFGFGLPPRIWGIKKGETIYSINWIPFGGFVRMLGEDSRNSSMLKNKRSFISQPIRKRIKVVVAGVVMNFLLAWMILFVGFSVGMQPLLSEDQILPAVSSGTIVLEEGLKINRVEKDSLADKIGFKPEDTIIQVDGKLISSETVAILQKTPVHSYKVFREGQIYSYEINEERAGDQKNLGVEFYNFGPFPRVKVFEVDSNGIAFKAGIWEGDIILTVNDKQVFTVEQYEQLVRGENQVDFLLFKDGQKRHAIIENFESKRVIISEVLSDSPAEKAGVLAGDVIVSINGTKFNDAPDVVNFTGKNKDKNLAYLISRKGEQILKEIKPEDGKIGVLLSELVDYSAKQDMSLYNSDVPSSVVEIKDQKFPVHIAFVESFRETFRLSYLTGKMFLGFVKGLVSGESIPETVAGPIGIAQMTHTFVQEGFKSLIRFVALLSLSLAAINILPLPALDGGRLLFILIELFIGRRINQKFETYIHLAGYGLILLLIIAVTYNDISRLLGF